MRLGYHEKRAHRRFSAQGAHLAAVPGQPLALLDVVFSEPYGGEEVPRVAVEGPVVERQSADVPCGGLALQRQAESTGDTRASRRGVDREVVDVQQTLSVREGRLGAKDFFGLEVAHRACLMGDPEEVGRGLQGTREQLRNLVQLRRAELARLCLDVQSVHVAVGHGYASCVCPDAWGAPAPGSPGQPCWTRAALSNHPRTIRRKPATHLATASSSGRR